MEARVKWVEDLTFMAESPSGHALLLSAGEEHGGKDNCLRPLELLLLGLGGCASIDVVSILKKARQEISNCEAIVSAERFDGSPSFYTTINCHFVVAGNNLSEKQVKRAVDLSFEKYCSVSFMLREKADITWSYELQEG
jgi:putative redox protein